MRDDLPGRSAVDTKFDSIASANWLQRLVLNRLSKIELGSLVIHDKEKSWRFGSAEASGHNQPDQEAVINVINRKFYKRLIRAGSLGAAESYIQGEWDTPDLCKLLQVLGRNQRFLQSVDGWGSKLSKPVRLALNWLKRNTRAGSRRNISRHYDLSNEFFSLMLDPSMTYSSAVFSKPSMSLDQAQTEKYDRLCRKLNLQADHRLIEIGTGWGGFAIHAAKHYGCHVTTTTISQQQYNFAAQRISELGLQDRITLLQQDYRDLKGQFDRLVSIEMIEAVGEKFLKNYFRQCSQLLKSDGIMGIQAITIPDHRYDAYRHSVDFIQRYIFPGGFLPSIRAIGESLAKCTDLRFVHSEDFGPHYALTLQMWRENFWRAIESVKHLGFDNRFIRTWEYYLCYCQAGFEERMIGVAQIVMTKPQARTEPILGS